MREYPIRVVAAELVSVRQPFGDGIVIGSQ